MLRQETFKLTVLALLACRSLEQVETGILSSHSTKTKSKMGTEGEKKKDMKNKKQSTHARESREVRREFPGKKCYLYTEQLTLGKNRFKKALVGRWTVGS